MRRDGPVRYGRAARRAQAIGSIRRGSDDVEPAPGTGTVRHPAREIAAKRTVSNNGWSFLDTGHGSLAWERRHFR